MDDISSLTNLSFRPCPVCLGQQRQILKPLNYALFDDLNLTGQKILSACSDCGMIYDDVSLTSEQLAHYYKQNAHYATTDQGGAGGHSDDNRDRYQRVLDALGPEPGSLILDLGCGQGGFLSYCCEQGFRAVGIEPSNQSRLKARNTEYEIYPSFESLQEHYSGSQIQSVVVSHVLEHLLEPLKQIQVWITWANQARFYFEVPDASAYLIEKTRWHELYFEHLSHFYPQHLALLAQLAGLQVIKKNTCSFSPLQSEIQCAYLVGTPGARKTEIMEPYFVEPKEFKLPQIPNLIRNQSIAIWGISQYTMLILGTYPELLSRCRLLDASSAKIGRQICGVEIECSSHLNNLSSDTLLILPYSSSLSQEAPAVVDELIPGLLSIGEVQGVLQNLLKERVSVRDMIPILEALADNARSTKEPDLLTEHARQALARSICQPFQTQQGLLPAMTLSADLEQILVESVTRTDQGLSLNLEPQLATQVVNSISRKIEEVSSKGYHQPVLICSSKVRLVLRRLTERSLPMLTVLSYNEVMGQDAQIQTIARIDLRQALPG